MPLWICLYLPAAKAQYLHDTAVSLLQYTPNVAFFETHALLLEVSASLSLFKGPRALLRHMRLTLQDTKAHARIGMAPTTLGAWLLARQADPRRRCLKPHTLHRRLDNLPAHALPAAHPHADWLDGIACHTLEQLRNLPRAGLQQRTSPLLVQQLDIAYGQVAHCLAWFEAPETFSRCINLDERLEHSHQVLAFSRRLIEQLCGWLQARQRASSVLDFFLHHEKGRHAQPPTRMTLRLSEHAWLPQDFIGVLQEQIQTLSLCAPVIALELSVFDTASRSVASTDLFPDPAQWMRQEQRLLDLLRARLGAGHILHAQPIADYRPEQANHWAPVNTDKNSTKMPPCLQPQSRPFWLLPQAVPLATVNDQPMYRNKILRLVQGPERLETGWWHPAGHDRRDYFIAQDSQGVRYWIYRQRETHTSSWFLHGLFG